MKDDTKFIQKMRPIHEKKGGGLMVLWNKEEIKANKIENQDNDILISKFNIN